MLTRKWSETGEALKYPEKNPVIHNLKKQPSRNVRIAVLKKFGKFARVLF